MHYLFDYIDQKEILLHSLIDRVHILPKIDIVASFHSISFGEKAGKKSTASFTNISSDINTEHLIKVLYTKRYVWNEMKALQFVICCEADCLNFEVESELSYIFRYR